MEQEIKMPSAGQTTDEATVVTVNVKVGDTVKRGDVLLEAETDKAVLPVESFTAGQVLDVLVQEGDEVTSGSVLVVVGKAEDAASYQSSRAAAAVPSPAVVPSSAPAAAPAVSVGKEVKMPNAGQTTDEATVVTVNVKVGDTVKRGDVLLEAETDKAVLPVESFIAGQVLDVLVEEGDSVTAGSTLVVIGKPEEAALYRRGTAAPTAVPPEAPAVFAPVEEQKEYLPIVKGQRTAAPAAAPAAAPVKKAPAAPAKAVYPVMPGAKMLAKEKKIDIAAVTPSNGRFVKRKDVLAYAEMKGAYDVMPMSRMRAVIARRMQESVQNIPAWQCTVSVDMTACMALREEYLAKKNAKLSYNDIMAKAIAVASRKFPLVNARYEDDEVRIFHHTNVGLAVALDGALVVPVVRNVDTKALEEIAVDSRAQIKKAREGKLTPADMGCGSITISNLGMYNVDQFVAIVNPPESCILAVGSIRVTPVWDGTAFQPVHMMTVTGSFDHRIIDGAYGAQFLQELKALMEAPEQLC